MNRMRVIGWLVATVLVAACGSSGGGGGGTSNSYSGKTIKFGSVLSLTGAGSVYGPQRFNVAKLAVKEINDSGGVNGAQSELASEDDTSDKGISAQRMQGLLQSNQVLALRGP